MGIRLLGLVAPDPETRFHTHGSSRITSTRATQSRACSKTGLHIVGVEVWVVMGIIYRGVGVGLHHDPTAWKPITLVTRLKRRA